MAEDQTPEDNKSPEATEELRDEFDRLQEEVDKVMQQIKDDEPPEELIQMQHVFFLWFLWADFHLYIIDPPIAPKVPAEVLPLSNGRKIVDYGYVMSTSVGDDLGKGRLSSRKLLESVEVMIDKAIELYDIKEVAFQGNEVAKRKAFEAVMQRSDKNIRIS